MYSHLRGTKTVRLSCNRLSPLYYLFILILDGIGKFKTLPVTAGKTGDVAFHLATFVDDHEQKKTCFPVTICRPRSCRRPTVYLDICKSNQPDMDPVRSGCWFLCS